MFGYRASTSAENRMDRGGSGLAIRSRSFISCVESFREPGMRWSRYPVSLVRNKSRGLRILLTAHVMGLPGKVLEIGFFALWTLGRKYMGGIFHSLVARRLASELEMYLLLVRTLEMDLMQLPTAVMVKSVSVRSISL